MFEVRRLRLLRELSVHGTIAAAARVCALTPSAVSQQLALLEREARTPLFIRDGRRLRLTKAATILVEHTERILVELEQAQAEVAALARSISGTMRLAAFPSAAGNIAASAIAECRAAHPDLRILLEDNEPDASLTDLRAQRIDAALVYEYNLLPRLAEPGIELRPLLREPLLLAVPPHRTGDGPGSLAEYHDDRWIAPHSDTALRTVLERACHTAGFTPWLDYTSDDFTVIMALVQAGLGVSLIPRSVVEPLATEVRLHPVPDFPLTRTVSVAVRTGSGTDPAIEALIAALGRAAGPGANPYHVVSI